jgi:hypothetical protein
LPSSTRTAVRLTPFSFTILVLVGRGGAGPHDLRPLAGEIDAAAEGVARSRAGADDLPSRRHLLEVNHRYAERLLALQREWLAEAEAVLAGRRDRADVA